MYMLPPFTAASSAKRGNRLTIPSSSSGWKQAQMELLAPIARPRRRPGRVSSYRLLSPLLGAGCCVSCFGSVRPGGCKLGIPSGRERFCGQFLQRREGRIGSIFTRIVQFYDAIHTFGSQKAQI